MFYSGLHSRGMEIRNNDKSSNFGYKPAQALRKTAAVHWAFFLSHRKQFSGLGIAYLGSLFGPLRRRIGGAVDQDQDAYSSRV